MDTDTHNDHYRTPMTPIRSWLYLVSLHARGFKYALTFISNVDFGSSSIPTSTIVRLCCVCTSRHCISILSLDQRWSGGVAGNCKARVVDKEQS